MKVLEIRSQMGLISTWVPSSWFLCQEIMLGRLIAFKRLVDFGFSCYIVTQHSLFIYWLIHGSSRRGVTSHERHAVSNQCQIVCSSVCLDWKQHTNHSSVLQTFCEGTPSVARWFPHKGSVMRETFAHNYVSPRSQPKDTGAMRSFMCTIWVSHFHKHTWKYSDNKTGEGTTRCDLCV